MSPNSNKMETLFSYLLAVYRRIEEEEKVLQRKAAVSPMSDMLQAARTQILNYSSLVLQDVFAHDVSPGLPYSPLLKPTLSATLPGGFLVDLARQTVNDWDLFKKVRT